MKNFKRFILGLMMICVTAISLSSVVFASPVKIPRAELSDNAQVKFYQTQTVVELKNGTIALNMADCFLHEYDSNNWSMRQIDGGRVVIFTGNLHTQFNTTIPVVYGFFPTTNMNQFDIVYCELGEQRQPKMMAAQLIKRAFMSTYNEYATGKIN